MSTGLEVEEKNVKKKGFLLVNLGSPSSPKLKEVKKYLHQFLMDKNVIDIPYLLRFFLVRVLIVPNRARHTAKLYKKIWTDNGSPLIINSKKLVDNIKKKVRFPVALAMRYGTLSIKKGIEDLEKNGVEQVFIIPLYPQYAMSTSGTVIEEVKKVKKKHFSSLEISYLPAFYNNDSYIKILANSIMPVLNTKKPDHLLFSYHGLPERHLCKTDPTGNHCLVVKNCCSTPSEAHKTCYKHQCLKTTELVTKKLGLKKKQYSISFQSRLGKNPWMQPYTSEKIKNLLSQKNKNLAVVTPAFVGDCLETIEEIGITAKKNFMKNGGESFTRIKCLNDNEDWVNLLIKWIEEQEISKNAY